MKHVFTTTNKFLILVILLLTSIDVKAQFYPNTHRSESDWQVNVGVQGLAPLFPPRNPGAGVTLSVRHFIENSISARASVGYNVVTNLYKQNDFKYIPAQLGVLAYVTPNFYVSGDAGFANSNRVLKDRLALWILMTPGFGYSFPNNGLDLAVQYDILHRNSTSVGIVGFKLSYSFNLSSY